MLRKSKVTFCPEDHTYFLEGKQLTGITGILSKHIFQRKYDSIPEEILQRAAEYGSYIHLVCELVDSIGIVPDCIEGLNYMKLKTQNNLSVLENEYLVSDNEYFASSIDIVFDDLSIGDIKTTYSFDEEYVSWQLSIYAYLFELQNPGLFIKKLYGVWLRKENYNLFEVARIPISIIQELLDCEITGRTFINPLINDSLPE